MGLPKKPIFGVIGLNVFSRNTKGPAKEPYLRLKFISADAEELYDKLNFFLEKKGTENQLT